MEDLSRSYWTKHKSGLLVAGVAGVALVTFATWMPAHNRGIGLGIFLMLALLCSPFTLRTAAGRLWWASYLIGLGSGITAVLIGITHPLWGIFALIAGCAYAVAVCLRYCPPAA